MSHHIMSFPEIRISCSSFMLPAPSLWSSLSTVCPLVFGEYGDWPTALNAQENSPLALILFLEDMFAPEEYAEQQALFFSLLKQRLSILEASVFLTWSAGIPTSPILEAKQYSAWRGCALAFEETAYEMAAHFPQLYLVNLDSVFAESGMSQVFDDRNYFAARCRLSQKGIACVANALAAVYERIGTPAKKVLVLDCDNTLWGGVVGEGGLENLVLGSDGTGKIYTHIQEAALAWSKQGVILALASKNNEDDVWKVFDEHPAMVLKRSDITAHAINWQEKADNLRTLAEQLDLGLSSFVFMDDNPLEREKVKHALPEVTVLELPTTVFSWPALLKHTPLFAKFMTTQEDTVKAKQYQSRSAFLSKQKESGDGHDFLRSIKLQATALPLDATTMHRAEQLCAKTNQFNLTLRRHTVADLNAMSCDPAIISFLGSLTDMFGDHGIVGLVIAKTKGDVAVLDSFMMSCRILGRCFEAWMLNYLCAHLKEKGVKWLVAAYVPGERNQLVECLLPNNGFLLARDTPMPNNAHITALQGMLPPSAVMYWADLDTLRIPHSELYDV